MMGYHYLVVFVDEFTRYVFGYLLPNRDGFDISCLW